MKILLAEDSAVMRRSLVDSLQSWNYDVVETEDGVEAWEQFQKERFPLVLSDWIMPEKDGLELIQQIRGCNLSEYTYIIMLTAKSEKDALVKAMEAGADDFLIKPCHPEELRVRVREGERIVRLERKLAGQNRRLQETQAALVQKEKLASLGQFAAGMAHEINNPISIVNNNLAVLRREFSLLTELLEHYRSARDGLLKEDSDLAKEIDALEKDCEWPWLRDNLPRVIEGSLDGLRRVRDIVNNLRDFARLDEADLDDYDINQAIESTLQLLSGELQAAGVTAETELQQPLPRVVCHPAKLNQVLYNLIENAIQASARGDTVSVRTSLGQDASVVVTVEDEGQGIEPSNLSRIFEPFFTTKPVGAGTGLGLAISYGIIRDHGGTIEVDSQVNQGSKFRVRLPVRRNDSSPVGTTRGSDHE